MQYLRRPRPDQTINNVKQSAAWGEEKRIITGADILGRLFKGIGHKASETVNIVSNEISNQDA